MRAPALVGIITSLHIIAITAFIFIQGCGTTNPTLHSSQEVSKPPTPVMPPRVVSPPTAVDRPVIPARVDTPPVAQSMDDAGSYTIKKGDTLSQIAKRFGISFRELAEANQLSNPNSIRIGQVLTIPPQAASGAALISTPTPSPMSEVSGGGGTYVVHAGDSLSVIASKYKVKVADLKSVNGLTSDRILVGQKLTIPGTGSGTTSSIGSSPDLSVQDLLDSTNVPDTPEIPDIEVPEVPPSVDPAPVAPVTTIVPQNEPLFYTVGENDTLDDISKLFVVTKADIMELNNLGPDEELTVGQRIQIPTTNL